MNAHIRRSFERLPAPLPVLVQGAYRFLRYPQVRRKRALRRRVLGLLGRPGRVAQGPFRGMRYLGAAYYSEVLPKLVGTYECEIAPAIEAVCRAGCDRVVDVGAAEGYYVVGMALRNPGVEVVAFEMNPSARYYLRRLARLNGVADRVTVRGTCDVASLSVALAGARRPALICDCEGAEDELLRPDRVEPLRRAFVVVETHDGLETGAGVLQGITARLRERFAATHTVEEVVSRERTPADLPGGAPLSPEDAAEAMSEGRPWARWLVLTPRPSTEAAGPLSPAAAG